MDQNTKPETTAREKDEEVPRQDPSLLERAASIAKESGHALSDDKSGDIGW